MPPVVAAQVEYHVCAIDIWRTDVLDAVMEVDGNCNIKQANNDACTMFGYPAAGMKTMNLSRLFQLAGDAYPTTHPCWFTLPATMQSSHTSNCYMGNVLITQSQTTSNGTPHKLSLPALLG